MTIYLLDDDDIQLELLHFIINKNSSLNIIGSNIDSKIGMQEIEKLKPKVLFLDIDINGVNGLDLYKSLLHKPLLILCTNHIEYALDGFDLDALAYLLKPIEEEKVFAALKKASNILDQKNNHINNINENSLEAIFIKDASHYHKFVTNDIMYIEAKGDYSEFNFVNNAKKIILVNLKQLDEQLPLDNFLRVSRTHIINIQHVQKANFNEVVIANIEINIGKTFAEDVLPAILSKQTIIKRK
jgi:two-component system, LytTR family, response regulator